VDVASKSLEARIGQQGAAGSFPNTQEGIAALAAFCQAHQVELVAMEATTAEPQPKDLVGMKAASPTPCAPSTPSSAAAT
jgi:transposase